MSIPYPSDFGQHLDDERHARRYALVVRMIDAGDVIAAVESQVAAIIDPTAHPLYGVVAHYLEVGGPETGRLPMTGW
jgi:hypothetical protein